MREFHLPLLFIILAIAHQMTFYLFYKFYQIRRENIGLNKFLIAFGLLYGFGFTGVVIRSINSYYIENLAIHNFLNDISHIIIAIAVFSFLILVAQKDFNKLINIKMAKIVALVALIFSIIILFIEEVIIILILIFSSIFIGFIFMALFHIKLIQKSNIVLEDQPYVFYPVK